MNSTCLLIGGNLGNRIENLNTAKAFIKKNIGKIKTASSIYEAAAWGITEQPDFLNQVLFVETEFSADQIMKKILSIENKMGRIRTEKNAPRIVDIDILFFNNDIINEKGLIIPHPEIQNRKFVLIPLAELSPDLFHPVIKKTVSKLLAECKDELDVKLFKLPVYL
ncbi:MAG: 2-amino-4-hydroxy-6-hydroxymethyldihydropteridine diphosphokinase [Bacteroidota bacterium]|nr:2-amino-4-hydroxy-6-hydroxymethyldihydropteridine diphosphokinase [Bacteroidota bacterium]